MMYQRTLSLGASFPACGNRTDGWCELNTFLQLQNNSLAEAQYDYSCNGYVNIPRSRIQEALVEGTDRIRC